MAQDVPRPAFATEQHLVALVQQLFAARSDHWTWISEFEAPNGIADLAAIRLSPAWRQAVAMHRVSPRWAYVLRCLPLHEPVSVAAFAQANNISPNSARRVLGEYSASGYCAFDAVQRVWRKVLEPEPIAVEIVAIEVKLRDWRRALYQACRYTEYATRSWVVLDEHALPLALPHVEDFRMRGIGLAGLGTDGAFEVVAHPRTCSPKLVHHFWHANACIARRLMDSGLEVAAVETV